MDAFTEWYLKRDAAIEAAKTAGKPKAQVIVLHRPAPLGES